MAKTGVIFNAAGQFPDNTLSNYGLAILSDVKLSSPELKRSYINVPGMDGALDASEAPQGFPVYKNRELSFSLFKDCGFTELSELRRELMTKYHGKRTTVILPFDSGFYYAGRFHIGELSGSARGIIPVAGLVYPYALEDGVWNEDATMTTSFQNLPIHNTGRRAVPTVIVSADTVVQTSYGGTPITLTVNSEGTPQEFILPELSIPASDDGTEQIVATWRVKLAASSFYTSFWVEFQRGHL